jgi:hypothetical protein
MQDLLYMGHLGSKSQTCVTKLLLIKKQGRGWRWYGFKEVEGTAKKEN